METQAGGVGRARAHFGVTQGIDVAYKQRPDAKLLLLYTTDEGGYVSISSDTWPGTGGVLGLTKSQIAEAKTKGVQPAGGAGFAYLQGPDGARRISRVHACRTFQPRSYVSRASILRPALVPETPQRGPWRARYAIH